MTNGTHRPHSARELLAGSLGADPYQAIQDLREAGERRARAEGVAVQLEHERHIVLARISNEIAQVHASEKISEAKLDRLARSDERYQRHIDGLAAAVEERELARSAYWALKSELEWDRASISHLNVMSKLEEPS